LMLRQWNAHGYELMDKLAAFGVQAINPGTFYRTLRQMEEMVWSVPPGQCGSRSCASCLLDYPGWRGISEVLGASLDQYQRMMNTFFELYTLPPAQHKKEDD